MGARRFLARLARALAGALDRDGNRSGDAEGSGGLRAVEEALETERERLRLVMRATRAGIVDWDIAAGAIWYSGRLKRLLGHGSNVDASGWSNFRDFVHPDERERVRELFVAELKSGAGPDATTLHKPMEFRMRRADGSYVWVQSLALTQCDARGRARRYVAAISEISARRAQEERLRDQIALTQAIVAQTPNAIFAKDRQGRFTLANRGWTEMSGVEAAEALGRTVHELYPPTLAGRFAKEDEELMAQGASAPLLEQVHEGPHPGQYRIVRKAVLSQDDRVLGLVCSSTDISDMKRIEAELKKSQERYDLALRATNEGVYDWNIADGTIFYSDNVYRVLGAPAAMKTPEDWRRRIHPDDRSRYDAALVEHFKGRTERFECTYRYAVSDGSWRWARQHGIAVRNAEGRAIRMIGATGDITALKAAESELAQRARFVEELVDALPISIAMRDTEGRYVLVNRTWERYFGVQREDALGKRRRELPGWSETAERRADSQDIENLDREMLARGPDYVPEARETLRLGRYYLMTRRALFDLSGSPLGVVSAGLDVTERRAT